MEDGVTGKRQKEPAKPHHEEAQNPMGPRESLEFDIFTSPLASVTLYEMESWHSQSCLPVTCPQCAGQQAFKGLEFSEMRPFIFFFPTDLSICLLRSPGIPTVAVNLNCQPDEIYNHHGNKPWGLSVRGLLG